MLTVDKDIIKVNRRVGINLLHTSESYWSWIQAIEQGTITVAAPMKQTVPVYVPRGTHVRIDIPYEGKRYSFQTSVLRMVSGDHPTWVLAYPEKLETINLRAFFRLDVNLDAAIALEKENDWRECVVTNLSGNGLLLSIKNDFPAMVGDKVSIRLTLPDDELMELVGVVVRKCEVFNDPDLVQLGLHFPEIEPLYQDRIMKYIFQQQRKLRQRGVL